MDVMKPSGESSSKRQEDGDATTGSERPLKKARYAWQVKGKYHLKNETDDSNKNVTGASVESSINESAPTSQGPSNALESSRENDMSPQYAELDAVESSDSSLLYISAYDYSPEQREYPRYVSSSERKNKSSLRRSSVKTCSSIQLLSAADAENLCITQWQEDRILKACVDNTINGAMDSWPENDEMNRSLNEYFDNLMEQQTHMDNSVENEGILMAISAHGLQNTFSSSSDASSIDENCTASSTQVSDIHSPLRCKSSIITDNSQINNETENKLPPDSNKLPDWQTDSQNASDSTAFAYFSDTPHSAYFYNNIQNSNTDSYDMDNNLDFMNTAVLHAIQSKGLTASGTEYG